MKRRAQRAINRARSIVLGILALICLPLAMAGIIGALLHSIRQQAHEIGVRLAWGLKRVKSADVLCDKPFNVSPQDWPLVFLVDWGLVAGCRRIFLVWDSPIL